MSGWLELGLAPGEAEVYQALLTSPEASVAALAALVGRAESAVAADLARLADVGLVQLVDNHAVPVPPDQGIEALIASAEQEIARRRVGIERAREVLPELIDAYLEGHARGAADAPYEELTEPAAVRSRIFRFAADAQLSAQSMIPGEAFSPEATEASRRVDELLLSRGVEVAYVVSEESCLTPHWRSYLRAIQEAGALVRVHPAPPLLAVLFDEAAALLPHRHHRGAIVLKGTDVIAPVSELFRHTWSDATPYAEVTGDDRGLSPRHRRVLILLSEGLTDEAIAKRMGVSSRTVRRLVSELCGLLQAHSRFEAGAEAVRRGLLFSAPRGEEPTHPTADA